MTRPLFDELPFWERPDLSPYLIHLTKSTKDDNGSTAFDNLVSILEDGKIFGSSNTSFIKGPNNATCFMDIPFVSLKYLLNDENTDKEMPRYEPFGIVVLKTTAYDKGCRPVLYMSDDELADLRLPEREKWRVVRFELSHEECVSWVHEREWRCKGDFKLPRRVIAVLVENLSFAMKLGRMLSKKPQKFKSMPKSILPLSVICQGLPYLSSSTRRRCKIR